MRTWKKWICPTLAILCFGIAAHGQDGSASINGPIFGFVEGSAGATIRPVRGVLGAAAVAPPLALDSEIRNAIVSPKQDYALAVRGDTGDGILIRLGGEAGIIDSLNGVRGGATTIALSPSGTAAAFVGQDRILQFLAGLPDMAQVIAEFDTSDIPGHLQSVAVSDDGTLAVLNFVSVDTATLWVLSAGGARWVLPAQRPSAASFVINRHDVVIADDAAEEVFLIANINQEAARLSVASNGDGFNAFAGVAASEDGLRVFISTRKSKTVTVADLSTGITSVLASDCKMTGFRPLKGTSVFRLSDPADGAVCVLDASGAEPRIIIVPVPAAVTAPPSEEVPQQ